VFAQPILVFGETREHQLESRLSQNENELIRT
jgi:hypothetical protein